MFAEKYSKYYELFHSDKPYKKEIEFVYSWASNPKRILDIGCGTAHYWNYYPKGTFIAGIDKSQDMMKESTHRGMIFQRDIEKGEFWGKDYDLVTALFDVVNYVKDINCFKNIPLKKGGYFIFDVWDADKVKDDGFQTTVKKVGSAKRTIDMLSNDWHKVLLMVKVEDRGNNFIETHTMYLHSEKKIMETFENYFEIVEVKPTTKWQQWWKLRKK